MDDDDWDEESLRIMAEQVELDRDEEVILEYGEAHPEDWAYLRFEDDPVRLVVAFRSNVDAHAAALRRRLEHPDRVEFRQHRWSERELAAVASEIEDRLETDGRAGLLRSISFEGAGVIRIDLRADQERLAAQLHEDYGEMLQIDVGRRPYPPDPAPRAPAVLTVDDPITVDGLEAELLPNNPSVRAGRDGFGWVVLRNVGDERIELETGQPVVGSVVQPGTAEVVGEYRWYIAGTGLTLTISPGEETRIPLVFGTCAAGAMPGYTVPPGEYGLRAVIPLRLRRDRWRGLMSQEGRIVVTPPDPDQPD